VTRHDDGHRVGAAGLTDSPRRSGASHGARQFAVAAGGPIGDAQQLAPNALLEGGAVEIEGQIELATLAAKIFGELADGFSEERILVVAPRCLPGREPPRETEV